jgi:hypothetical protein
MMYIQMHLASELSACNGKCFQRQAHVQGKLGQHERCNVGCVFSHLRSEGAAATLHGGVSLALRSCRVVNNDASTKLRDDATHGPRAKLGGMVLALMDDPRDCMRFQDCSFVGNVGHDLVLKANSTAFVYSDVPLDSLDEATGGRAGVLALTAAPPFAFLTSTDLWLSHVKQVRIWFVHGT